MFLSVGNQHFNSNDIAVFTPDGYVYFTGRPACVQIDSTFRDRFAEQLLSIGFVELEGGRLLGLNSIAMVANDEARLCGAGLIQAVVLSAKDMRTIIMGTGTDLEPVGHALVRLSEISFVTADGYVRLKDDGMSVKVMPEEASALAKKLSEEMPRVALIGSALREMPKQSGPPDPPKAA